jgi:hypothetical protein
MSSTHARIAQTLTVLELAQFFLGGETTTAAREAGIGLEGYVLKCLRSRIEAETERRARLADQARELNVACGRLGLAGVAVRPLQLGSARNIEQALQTARALDTANSQTEQANRAKRSEIAAETRALAIEQARIAALRSDRAVLVQAARAIDVAVPPPPSAPDRPAVKASERARAMADAWARENEDFHGYLLERRADMAVLGDRTARAWTDAASELERERRRAQADALAGRLDAILESLPPLAQLPEDLAASIVELKSGADARLFEQVAKRLARAQETAALRAHAADAVAHLDAQAAAIGAHDFVQRGQMLLADLAALPGDAGWDARRVVEHELARLELEFADRAAAVAAEHARESVLRALAQAFLDQGLKLSTRELETWTPKDGELRRAGTGIGAGAGVGPGAAGGHAAELFARVPGSRKAVRVAAQNEPGSPDRIGLVLDQVWLGESGAPDNADPAHHDQVCSAIDAAVALLPGLGVDLGAAAVEQTPEDPDLPVIGLGRELEEALVAEAQVAWAGHTGQANANVRAVEEPGKG